MSIVRKLSLMPLILLLLTLGCSEESAEKEERKAPVSGVITNFVEEKGQVLIDNEEDNGNKSGPILISLHTNAELIINGETVTAPLDATLVGRRAEVWTGPSIAKSSPPADHSLEDDYSLTKDKATDTFRFTWNYFDTPSFSEVMAFIEEQRQTIAPKSVSNRVAHSNYSVSAPLYRV